MSAPGKFSITPKVVEAFTAYYRDHITWGVFHLVLDDGNDAAEHHDWCYRKALAGSEQEQALAALWAQMSKSQRHRVAARAVKTVWSEPPYKRDTESLRPGRQLSAS